MNRWLRRCHQGLVLALALSLSLSLPALGQNKRNISEMDLFKAYLELGRADEAIAEYERMLKINPRYPRAAYHLAQAYERKGDGARARVAYERFLQIWQDADTDIPEVRAAKARLHSK